jgi:FKBP-type peptidyl-prolyl cis-trans isomerase FkpA
LLKNAGIDHYDILHIKAGSGIAFPGLDEALLLFNRGIKVKFIIPSKIAYGTYVHQGIEPYTPLIFDIEILDK